MTTHLSDDVATLHVYQQPKLIYINSEISAKKTHLFLLSHRPSQFLSCEISIRHRSIPWTNQQLKTWITPASKARANLNTNWLPDMLRGEREGRGDSNIKGTASSGLAEIHVQNCDSISNYNFACSSTIMSTATTYSFKVFMFLISKQFLGVCRVDIMYLFVNIYLWYCQISYVKSSLTLTCTDFCQEDLPGYIHDWVIE